jgi:hypothetical protein
LLDKILIKDGLPDKCNDRIRLEVLVESGLDHSVGFHEEELGVFEAIDLLHGEDVLHFSQLLVTAVHKQFLSFGDESPLAELVCGKWFIIWSKHFFAVDPLLCESQ